MKTNYIKYIGKDVKTIDCNNPIKRLCDLSPTFLTKNKIYKLAIAWEVNMEINGHWIFYIYDDINDGESRGFEIKISDIETIREHNLNIILG